MSTDNAVIDATSEPVEGEDPKERPPLVGEDGAEWGDTTREALPPEVLPERRPQDLAVERAADAALDSVVPRKDEILTLAMEARMLAYGNLVPGPLRGKPADVFLILLVGRDLGIAQTSALQQVYVVDGKPSLAPKLLNARLRHLKLGGIYRHPDNSNEWAAALIVPWGSVERLDRGEVKEDGTPLRPVDVAIDRVVFTIEDAKQAGLANKENWKKYPQRMLWWRAAGYAADDFFPEASLGLYAPDELGAVTDQDGQPIDVNSVEVPDGFDRGGARGGSDDADDGEVAKPEKVWAIQERIRALPEDQRGDLRQQWTNARGLKGASAHRLTNRQVSLVESMLRGREAAGRSAGWDQDAALAAVRSEVSFAVASSLGPLLLWPEAVSGATEGDDPAAEGQAPDEADAAAQEAAGQEPQEAPGWVQDVIEEVRAMSRDQVDEFLKLWTLPKSGSLQAKRARVAEAKVREKKRLMDEAEGGGAQA